MVHHQRFINDKLEWLFILEYEAAKKSVFFVCFLAGSKTFNTFFQLLESDAELMWLSVAAYL